MRKPVIVSIGLVLAVVVAWACYVNGMKRPNETHWTMINVSPARGQADCHLIEFANGARVLVDAAEAADAPGVVLTFLRSHNIRRLDFVIISHFHWDHYGRLRDIIEAGIEVERVVVNLPASRELADREYPWGCDWDDVQALLAFLRERGIPYSTPSAGDRLIDLTVDKVRMGLDVVCLYDGVHTPVGETDINDTSILLRLSHGKTRALFTGDLNNHLGTYLAQSAFDLSADLLKVPHHGADGLAPNSFFDRVNPRTALVPAPKDLWLAPRSKRARDYFTERCIPTFVSGLNGNVLVVITDDGFRVQTEREEQYPTPS